MKYFAFVFFTWFAFSLQCSFAQDAPLKSKDSTKAKVLKLNAFPVLFYLPETGLGYGGVGIGTFRFKDEFPDSRPSTAQLALTYTSKNQILLFAPFELYKDQERWRFVGEIGYYEYFYNFFGGGVNSQRMNLEIYSVNFARARLTVLREILTDFSVGLSYEFDSFSEPELEEGGLLDFGDFVGKDGGIVSNLGVSVVYDTRDHIFFPTKGFFIQGNLLTSMRLLGSSFDYNKLRLDSRYYQQIRGRHILASSNSGEVPFYDLNWLGSKRTRGFDNRRFQDNAELSISLEYRFPIYKRFEGVAFSALATVAEDFNSLFSSSLKNATGAGLRYTINKKEGTRLRIDYGITNEGGNFYFTINESF